MEKELTYSEVQLGERAHRAHLGGVPQIEVARTLPHYINTHDVYSGLTTTDVLIAGILSGMNVWALGEKATGKSRAMKDISHFLFGGDIRNGGDAYTMKMEGDAVIQDHLLHFDKENGVYVPSGTHNASFFGIDEINHAHAKKQSVLYGFLEGNLDFDGIQMPCGKDNYFTVFATGNDPRKADETAAFDSAGSFVNRFGLILDLEDSRLAWTDDDEIAFNEFALPNSKYSYTKDSARNLLPKIRRAHNEILTNAQDLGTEAEAAFNYLGLSLSRCPGQILGGHLGETLRKSGIKMWAHPNGDCFDCERKSPHSESPLCRLINTSNMRVLQNSKLLASGLDYVARLKGIRTIDPTNLAFLSYELACAYQNGVLNSEILEEDFSNKNHQMAHEVLSRAREDFRELGDKYVTQLELARQGKDTPRFYSINGEDNYVFESPLTPDEKRAIQIQTHFGQEEIPSELSLQDRTAIKQVSVKDTTPVYEDNRETPLGILEKGLNKIREGSRRRLGGN